MRVYGAKGGNMKRKLLILLTLMLAMLFTVTVASACVNNDGGNKEYTVTFDTDGGSEIESQTVLKGGYAVKPDDPEKAGYTFEGWYTSVIEDWVFDKLAVTGNVTLKAKWSIINYTITYDLDGGENVAANPATFNVESETITLAEPNKDGYKFLGWKEGDNFVTEIAKGSVGNRTLTAMWKNKFVLYFDTSDGSTVTPTQMEVVYGQAIAELPVPVNGEKSFARWVDGNGDPVYSGDIWEIFSDLTVYPEWINSEDILLTLDTAGGTLPEDVKVYVQSGKKVGKLPVPVYEGYKFKGWTLDDESPVTENTIWDREESATLVATYVRVFKVQFTTTAIVRKALVLNKLVKSGGINLAPGQELEDVILEIEEGQTLRDIEIDELPTITPFDTDEYTYKEAWRYYESITDVYPDTITVDTVFNDTNFPGNEGVIVLRPYVRCNWTPTY